MMSESFLTYHQLYTVGIFQIPRFIVWALLKIHTPLKLFCNIVDMDIMVLNSSKIFEINVKNYCNKGVDNDVCNIIHNKIY